MINLLLAVVAVASPMNSLDIPPDMPIEVITWNANATETADRGTQVQVTETNPPPVPATAAPPAGYSSDSVNGRCVGAEDLLRFYSPGWPVERMSRIMYRESRCDTSVRNRSSSATGLLQILASHCPWLARQMDTWCTRDRLNDPHFNVRAAAVLYREQGLSAWSTS